MSFTDKDRELLFKLAEVANLASDLKIEHYIRDEDALGLLLHAEVASGARQIMYHIAEARKVDRTELWDMYDI